MIHLHLDGRGPVYAQLVRALKTAILDGRLAPGTRLPATRALAAELGLSRNSVLIAYEQLCAEGFVEARVGSGTYVSEVTFPERPRKGRQEIAPQSRYSARLRPIRDRRLLRQRVRYDLQYGEPLANPSIINAWRRELVRAARKSNIEYPQVRGIEPLRRAICDYLARRRGVQADPEDILIINGAQQAFALIARVLVDEGDPVVLEEPSYFGLRRLVQAHGARIVPVPVDDDGIDCSRLPGTSPKLVCVTPSHQFPCGAVLSFRRRLELLHYASAHRCWIVEDDYDGEFRYDGRPVAALRELDRDDRVIYVGTFSKVLFPSLRLGYMVLPSALRRDFTVAKWIADLGSPAIEQQALASFMNGPGFDRHLRLASQALRQRRKALLSALEEHAGDRVRVVDSPAGMHVVVWLPGFDRAACEALIDSARERGVGLYSIAPHYHGEPPCEGLLVGYAGLPAEDLAAAIEIFGTCLAEQAPPRRRRAASG